MFALLKGFWKFSLQLCSKTFQNFVQCTLCGEFTSKLQTLEAVRYISTPIMTLQKNLERSSLYMPVSQCKCLMREILS